MAIGIVVNRQAAKRREAVMQLAVRLGLTYFGQAVSGFFGGDPVVPPTLGFVVEELGGFYPFDRGHSRRIDNLILGEWEGKFCAAFEYSFKEGSGKNTSHYAYTVCMFRLMEMVFPRVELRPENLFDRLGTAVGIRDIEMESEEFNRRYRISCEDRKFAFKLLDPRMMEYLMRIPPRHWQLRSNYMVVVSKTREAMETERILVDMNGFLEAVPELVQAEIGSAPAPANGP